MTCWLACIRSASAAAFLASASALCVALSVSVISLSTLAASTAFWRSISADCSVFSFFAFSTAMNDCRCRSRASIASFCAISALTAASSSRALPSRMMRSWVATLICCSRAISAVRSASSCTFRFTAMFFSTTVCVTVCRPLAPKMSSARMSESGVWANSVMVTDSSVKPLRPRSSRSALLTSCAKCSRFMCSARKSFCAATARRAPTSLGSSSSWPVRRIASVEACPSSMPRVRAAFLTSSSAGSTRM